MSFEIIKPLTLDFEKAAGLALTEVLEKDGKAVIKSHFGQQSPPNWPGLKPATITQRRELLKRGLSGFSPDKPIMYRTGQLEKEVVKNAVKIETTNGQPTGVIWTNYPIAVYLNKTRPIYSFNPSEKKQIGNLLLKVFVQYLSKK